MDDEIKDAWFTALGYRKSQWYRDTGTYNIPFADDEAVRRDIIDRLATGELSIGVKGGDPIKPVTDDDIQF
jgi:hypothetical protein